MDEQEEFQTKDTVEGRAIPFLNIYDSSLDMIRDTVLKRLLTRVVNNMYFNQIGQRVTGVSTEMKRFALLLLHMTVVVMNDL